MELLGGMRRRQGGVGWGGSDICSAAAQGLVFAVDAAMIKCLHAHVTLAALLQKRLAKEAREAVKAAKVCAEHEPVLDLAV
jgi:hypothetical protein